MGEGEGTGDPGRPPLAREPPRCAGTWGRAVAFRADERDVQGLGHHHTAPADHCIPPPGGSRYAVAAAAARTGTVTGLCTAGPLLCAAPRLAWPNCGSSANGCRGKRPAVLRALAVVAVTCRCRATRWYPNPTRASGRCRASQGRKRRSTTATATRPEGAAPSLVEGRDGDRRCRIPVRRTAEVRLGHASCSRGWSKCNSTSCSRSLAPTRILPTCGSSSAVA